MKRLFLFAGYDRLGSVGPALEYYIRSLSRYGDIITVMDNECPDTELSKLSGLVLHAEATRHGEYDFGSYKRAYFWASANLDLTSYDFCYLLNDSVYGPLYELGDCLDRMENLGSDAFGLVLNPHRRHPHLQSWFIGMGQSVFMSGEFLKFIGGVTAVADKESVCIVYETGFTEMLHSSGFSYAGLFRIPGRQIYNNVLRLYRNGLPFFKKAALTRHNGSLGAQVRQILDNLPPDLKDIITEDAGLVYGREYIAGFLSGSRMTMAGRYLRYLTDKLR